MILADWQIKKLCEREKMISPFVDHQVRGDVISYGLTSYGYDMRIGPTFKLFGTGMVETPNTEIETNLLLNRRKLVRDGQFIDPKNLDGSVLVEHTVDEYLLMPPKSYALGHSVESFIIPRFVLATVIGKSTYARSGLIVNVTPLEPEWCGVVTIELSNATDYPLRVYANEGIAQVIFSTGNEPHHSYKDKGGKYQGQVGVTLPKL